MNTPQTTGGLPADVAHAALDELADRAGRIDSPQGWILWGLSWEHPPVALGRGPRGTLYGAELRAKPLLSSADGLTDRGPRETLAGLKLQAPHVAAVLWVRKTSGDEVLLYCDRAGRQAARTLPATGASSRVSSGEGGAPAAAATDGGLAETLRRYTAPDRRP